MDKQEILKIKTRKDIYNLIKKNPGKHFREIKRELKIPVGTLDYHLHYLMKKEFIKKKVDKKYTRFYVSKDTNEVNTKLINILRQKVPRNIILYLFLRPDSSINQIIKFGKKWKNHPTKIGFYLDKHRTTIEYHLKKLIDLDIIESHKKGKTRYYFIKNYEDLLDLFIVYEESILEDAQGRFLKYLQYIPKDLIDKYTEAIFDIFPHPYYG